MSWCVVSLHFICKIIDVRHTTICASLCCISLGFHRGFYCVKSHWMNLVLILFSNKSNEILWHHKPTRIVRYVYVTYIAIYTDHRDREVYKYKILWIFQCSFWKMLKIQAAINHCLSLIWFPPEMCIRICGRGFAIFVPMMLTDSLLTSWSTKMYFYCIQICNQNMSNIWISIFFSAKMFSFYKNPFLPPTIYYSRYEVTKSR